MHRLPFLRDTALVLVIFARVNVGELADTDIAKAIDARLDARELE